MTSSRTAQSLRQPHCHTDGRQHAGMGEREKCSWDCAPHSSTHCRQLSAGPDVSHYCSWGVTEANQQDTSTGCFNKTELNLPSLGCLLETVLPNFQRKTQSRTQMGQEKSFEMTITSCYHFPIYSWTREIFKNLS